MLDGLACQMIIVIGYPDPRQNRADIENGCMDGELGILGLDS